MFADVSIVFSPGSLLLLNGIIALMMFGVSMQLTPADFSRVLRQPRAPVAGLLAQFVLLPAGTCAATALAGVEPELALGMILIASCPGGTFSNVMTWLAKASVPVSVSMTAVSSLVAIVATPFNFGFYGWLNPHTRPLLVDIAMDPLAMLTLVALVLALPMGLGMLAGRRWPDLAIRVEKPMRIFALAVFLGFVIIAFSRNFTVFTEYLGHFIGLVVLHNILALSLGALAGRLAGLPKDERRAVTMEVGIQNSALGLTILFTFFPQAGGMMLIVAFWGVWHLISGLSLALYWSSEVNRNHA